MSSLNKTAKNASIYVLLGFLAPAVNLILIPIYTIELSTSDFGVITIATIIISVLINLTGLGINGAFNRYYYEYLQNRSSQLRLFSTAILTILISGLIIGALFWWTGQAFLSMLFSSDTLTIAIYGMAIIGTAVGLNIQMLIQSLYRNDENIRLYSFWAIIFFLSAVTGIYLGVVVYKMGAYGSIAGRAWGILFPTALFLVVYFIKYPPVWNKKKTIAMLKYGWPLVIYLMVSLAFNSVDKVILERYFGDLSVLGVYGFATLIASVIEIFLNAINGAVNPQVYRLLKEKESDHPQIKKLLSIVVLVLMLLLLALISVASPAILWFIDPEYHSAINYLPLLFISYIPRIYFTIFSIPLFYYKNTRVLPWISSISFLAGLVFSVLFIPLFGIYGACYALFLIRFIQCLLTIFIAYRMKSVNLDVFLVKNTYTYSIIIIVCTLIITSLQYYLASSWIVWLYLPVALMFCLAIWIKFRNQLVLHFRSIIKL